MTNVYEEKKDLQIEHLEENKTEGHCLSKCSSRVITSKTRWSMQQRKLS